LAEQFSNVADALSVFLPDAINLNHFMAVKKTGWGKWIVILIVVAALGAFGVWHFTQKHSDAPQYETTPVSRGDLVQEVTATGTLNPVTNVLVGCQVSGTINKIYVDYNSIVKDGQLIAELDPSTYQAQLDQAEANLANAKANLELQQVQAVRESQLYTNNLVAGSDYDTTIATLHEAEATVKLNQAAVSMAAVNVGYCKIYSPVDGIVIVNNIEVGQTVAASFNTPELFQIANNLKQMQIDSSVAEADVGGVREGQEVDFSVDAYPYRTFHGSVTQVRNSPTTVNNVVTYDCVISVTNDEYKLKPGMTANVSIIVAQHTNTLEIPNGALRFHPPEMSFGAPGTSLSGGMTNNAGMHAHTDGGPFGGRTVFVLSGQGKDAKLEPVRVKTGITDGINTEVLDGLKEGDNVVTGTALDMSAAAQGGGPFGGGFPRFR
jgi:HlyD family secretion protein